MTGELCGLCSDCPTTGTWFRLFILDLLSVSAVGSTIPRPAVCCHWCASGRPVAAAAQHVRIIGGPLDTSWSSTFPLATAVSLSCPPTIFLATIWTAVGFLNSFLRAYPLRFDGRLPWFLMDVSSTRRAHGKNHFIVVDQSAVAVCDLTF